jgi:hypothetical protein
VVVNGTVALHDGVREDVRRGARGGRALRATAVRTPGAAGG